MSRRPAPSATPARAPGTVTSPFAARYRTVTVGMVALVALSAFEALAVTTAMPTVVAELGGLGLYATAFAGPMASGIVGMVGGGGWSDRRGPARPLVTGVALFVAGLVVAGTATSMLTVVAGRVVQGLGGGMLVVALYVLVARVYPDAVRPRLFSAFSAAWVLPAIVGPAIAGTVAERFGWRWVFLAVPLLAVPALALLRPALRGTATAAAGGAAPAATQGAAAADPAGGTAHAATPAGGTAHAATPAGGAGTERARLVRAVGTGVGLLALQSAGQRGGAPAVALAAAGLALLAATAPRLLPLGTLRAAPGIPAVVGLRGVLAAAFFGAEVYLPLLLTTERGLAPSRAGLALTVGAVTWSLGSWLRGRAEGRWDDRRVLRAAAAGIATGVGLAALSVWPAVPVAVGVVGWGAAGLGMGLGYPTLSLLTLRLSRPSEQGVNTSALQLNEALSTALLLAVTGPVFAALVPTRPAGAFLACFTASITLAAAGLAVAGRVPRTTAATSAATAPAPYAGAMSEHPLPTGADGAEANPPTAVQPTEGERRAVAALEAAGIAHTLTRHGRVRSLAEAAAARGIEPSGIVKTLVVRRGDDDHLFVLVPGDRTISWPKLRDLLGVSRLSMPDAATAQAVTGYERGTITPFGSTHAWPVIADARVPGRPVSIGAGAHGTAATVDGDDLVRVLGAQVADVTEPETP